MVGILPKITNDETMTTTTSTSDYWTATATSVVNVNRTTEEQCDDENEYKTMRHTPGHKLSGEERMKKSDLHKFGLCAYCDAGLDDRTDFVCSTLLATGGFALVCNACNKFFTEGEEDVDYD